MMRFCTGVWVSISMAQVSTTRKVEFISWFLDWGERQKPPAWMPRAVSEEADASSVLCRVSERISGNRATSPNELPFLTVGAWLLTETPSVSNLFSLALRAG